MWALSDLGSEGCNQPLDIIIQRVYADASLGSSVAAAHVRRRLEGRGERQRLRCRAGRKLVRLLYQGSVIMNLNRDTRYSYLLRWVERSRGWMAVLSTIEPVRTSPWWCGRLAIRDVRRHWPTSTHHVLLSHVLLGLECVGPRLDEGVLNGADNIRRKDRPRVDGARHRLLPCLEHLIHLPPRGHIDGRVGVHEGLIELATKEQRVRSADILDDRVKNV